MSKQEKKADETAPSRPNKSDESSDSKSSRTTLTLSDRLDNHLFKQISIAPLVYFRIAFGSIMLWEIYRYFAKDKISYYYIEPEFHFKYFLLEWTPPPLPGNLMYIFFVVMAILYVFVVLGLWYRLSILLASLGFAYWLFLEMATWLNHFYLLLLIHFAMIFVPAHRNASLDVLRRPELRVATVSAWARGLLIYLVSIPYFFGALAKIQPDWMLGGEPMRMWLLDKNDFPYIGYLFEHWAATYFFSWNGMLFDLLIVPLLLWKKTRVVAIASTLFFHLMNDRLFTIGIFPWFMMAATPLYFEPEWVSFAFMFEWIFCKPVVSTKSLSVPASRRPLVRTLLFTYCGILFIMPFRHYFYPGNTCWTEEGYLYSWQMMLRDKDGWADFKVVTETKDGVKEEIQIDDSDFLTGLQSSRMIERPHMMIQFAHYLCQIYSDGNPSVFVESIMSLNGRERQHLIDPNADLCKEKISLWPAKWIVPLHVPLDIKADETIELFLEHADPLEYIGRRVAKKFGSDGIFLGTVHRYEAKEKKWRVYFDDGDSGIFDDGDLVRGLYLYQFQNDEKSKKKRPLYEEPPFDGALRSPFASEL